MPKNAGTYALYQKIEDRDANEHPVNNSVLSTFKDKNFGIYAGSCHLTARQCCKLQHFVRWFMFNV